MLPGQHAVAKCSQIWKLFDWQHLCNSADRFVKKLSCFHQIGFTLLYYEHFAFNKLIDLYNCVRH